MFRNLPVFEQDEKDLQTLAESMIQDVEQPFDKDLGVEDEDENTEIPAGYTYLGQFIDHDITFDPVSSLQRQNDPDALIDSDASVAVAVTGVANFTQHGPVGVKSKLLPINDNRQSYWRIDITKISPRQLCRVSGGVVVHIDAPCAVRMN